MSDDSSPLAASAMPGSWNGASPLAGSAITPSSTRQQVSREIQDLGSDEQAIAASMAAKSSALKDVLTQATQRLQNTPVGPSSGEQWQSMMGAWLSAPGVAGAGRMASAVAQSMAAQREAQLNKQQLLAQYGANLAQYQTAPSDSLPGSGSDASNGANEQQLLAKYGPLTPAQLSQLGQGLEQKRVTMLDAQMRSEPVSKLPEGVQSVDPQTGKWKMFGGQLVSPIDYYQMVNQAKSMGTSAGRQFKVTNSDGTTQLVWGLQPPSGPGILRSEPVTSNTSAGTTPAAGPGRTGRVGAGLPTKADDPSIYNDMFTPSVLLPGGYASLSPDTQPIYAKTAAEAFDPSNFQNYAWKAQGGAGFGPSLIDKGAAQVWTKTTQQKAQQLQQAASAAQQSQFNYSHMLTAMDDAERETGEAIRTGAGGKLLGTVQNSIRGIVGDQIAGKIFNDPDMLRLANEQQVDKYALQAATLGLKSIYGSRPTNLDVTQRLKSLPSRELIPAVARELSRAQLDVAQDDINKSAVFGQYSAMHGDPNKFDAFYNANFNPFAYSRLNKSLSPVLADKFSRATAVRIDNPADLAKLKPGQYAIYRGKLVRGKTNDSSGT